MRHDYEERKRLLQDNGYHVSPRYTTLNPIKHCCIDLTRLDPVPDLRVPDESSGRVYNAITDSSSPPVLVGFIDIRGAIHPSSYTLNSSVARFEKFLKSLSRN